MGVGTEEDFAVTAGDDGTGDGGGALVMLDREGWRKLVDCPAAVRVQELVAPPSRAPVSAAFAPGILEWP